MAENPKPLDQAGGGGELVPHPLPARAAKIDLRDSHAIRREMGAVYRDARSGRIPTQDATRLGYLLNLLRQAYETGELQDRIDRIEAHFDLNGGGLRGTH